MRHRKVRVCANVSIARVEKPGTEYAAPGRRPNTTDLGLAEAGVEVGGSGRDNPG